MRLENSAKEICGGVVGPLTLGWTDSSGEITDSATKTAFAQTERGGWFRIQMGDFDQCLDLVAQPRHFGGRQWYFRSPITHRWALLHRIAFARLRGWMSGG